MLRVNKKERKLKGSIALYLDYRINGERHIDRTNLHLYPGTDDRTRQANKDNLMRFEKRRNELEAKLLNGYIPIRADKQKVDFYKYFEEHFIKFPTKERRAKSVLKKLKAFYKKPQLPIACIDESFLSRFADSLECLNGETAHNYFKLLSRVLHYATKDRLFEVNPATDIKIKKKQGIPKNILTIDELKILAGTECNNDNVKRAFLFCCFTGLRYCDVSRLQWAHISNDKLSIKQAKTGFNVEVYLHANALQFMGSAGVSSQPVFNLPTTLNGCNKILKAWVAKAGISKKITWHCGRHTIACNLIANGVDIVTVSKILGQTTPKHAYRYIVMADMNLRNAIHTIPAF